jgi:pyruvate formate lyase activating enzyme
LKVLISAKKESICSAGILMKHMTKPIYSITPFTLLDYPDQIACILWFAGCNMRCPYCYNPEIVTGKGKLSISDFIDFFNKRLTLLDAVVMSGGECTLHPEVFMLADFIKQKGLSVKVDTNGSKPSVLKKLLGNGLIDYVALDFKATHTKFQKVTGTDIYSTFIQSLELLLKSNIKFEVRTTVHSDLLSTDDILEMSSVLDGAGYINKYYIQHYCDGKETLGISQRSDSCSYKNLLTYVSRSIVFRNF